MAITGGGVDVTAGDVECRRPSVVALGGGHGLAVTLCAVSRYAGQVTAVVSVADDGGSSGRLRAFWPGPAPGDIRRCLLALAGDGPDEKLWAEVFDHRFAYGELAGHSLGNLVLVALSELTGDFATATAEMATLLGVKARVLPATLGAVDLCAEVETAVGRIVVEGQAKVTHSPGPVRRMWLSPVAPPVPDEVLAALAGADQVVLGPGSLFTSVLAVCAVPAIREALAGRAGGRVYISNLSSQEYESAGFNADAHLGALAAHGVVVDAVVCDPATEVGAPRISPPAIGGAPRERDAPALREVRGARAARAPQGALDRGGAPAGETLAVVEAALANPDGRSHNPAFLAEVLAGLAGVGRGSSTST